MDLNKPALIELSTLGNAKDGFLTVLDAPNMPFEVKRLFWIHGFSESVTRGGHAHKSLMQVLICVHGSVGLHLENTNGELSHYDLNRPEKVLFLPPYCWHTMSFSPDAVLLCAASAGYVAEDYIRDRHEFESMNK